MRLILAILLVLTHTSLTQSEVVLIFSPATATCTGGGANDAHLYPSAITCTNPAAKPTAWTCVSTRLHDAFLRIHHARVSCVDGCVLEYHLDFTPLAVFAIGFATTVFAGVFLAVAMYLAVVKMASRYGHDRFPQERCLGPRRPGYGSFGGRLYCLGHFSDSVKSLLEFDVEDPDLVPTPPKEEEDEEKEEDKVDWVAERIYFG